MKLKLIRDSDKDYEIKKLNDDEIFEMIKDMTKERKEEVEYEQVSTGDTIIRRGNCNLDYFEVITISRVRFFEMI